jgi:hypothetical protein
MPTESQLPRERSKSADWEHLCLLAIFLAFVVWYLSTAAAASATFSNLILIGPVGIVATVLLLYIASTEIPGARRSAAVTNTADEAGQAAHAPPGRFRSSSIGTVLALMVLFTLFVAAMPYAGFDISSFVFTLATLWLLGERRVAFSFALALATAIAISIAALALLTFPMPLGIARALWRAL